MRVVMLFYMDDKYSNYKIDPDNQMHFMDITGLRVVIKNCKLFRDQPKWHEWQKQIGDIRNSLAHNSFMKLSEELFRNQLQTIKHVLVEIDMSEDLDGNAVFSMAREQINKIEKWYEHLSTVNQSHSTTF
jgi:hypothetical protein